MAAACCAFVIAFLFHAYFFGFDAGSTLFLQLPTLNYINMLPFELTVSVSTERFPFHVVFSFVFV